MVAGVLGQILQELGTKLEVPNLSPDNNETCLIQLKNGIKVQMELDPLGQFLIMGTVVGTVPTGRYRIDLFKVALKANNLPPPLHGIFAFSKKTDHLVLYERISVQGLHGDLLAEEIVPFSEKAKLWQEAINHNEVPTIEQNQGIAGAENVFGLRR